jgi:hypothetical protein
LASLIQLAGNINRIIRESGLLELGQLEQDLVFGDAAMKDVIKFLTMKELAFQINGSVLSHWCAKLNFYKVSY